MKGKDHYEGLSSISRLLREEFTIGQKNIDDLETLMPSKCVGSCSDSVAGSTHSATLVGYQHAIP